MKIQKYKPVDTLINGIQMLPEPHGEFVKYSDHEKIVGELVKVLTQISNMNDSATMREAAQDALKNELH